MEGSVDLKFFRRVLEERRLELNLLIKTARDNARPVELDQSKIGRLSRMDAMQSQAMARDTERRRRFDLQRVEAAIKRVECNDFGFCIVCDNLIPQKRLEFDPATTTCVDCASKGH
jgi:DnaK suppressor protein